MINRLPKKRMKYRWLIYSDADSYIQRKIAKEVKNVSKNTSDLDALELIKFTALFVKQQGNVEVLADLLIYLAGNNYEDLYHVLDYRYDEVYQKAKKIAEEIILEINSKKQLHAKNVSDVGTIVKLYKAINANISFIFLDFINWLYSLQ